MRIDDFAMALAGAAVLATVSAEPISAQQPGAWQMYQFAGTETFKYDIRHTTDDGVAQGHYNMALNSSGGQTMASIDAALGDASCSTTMPMSTPQMILPQMMMQCMMVAPVAMTMFAPTWAMFMGQSWQVGAEMQWEQGDDHFSFRITETCTHAGVEGVLGEIRTGDADIDTCVATDVPLPLYVKWINKDDDETIEIELTEFSS